MLEESDDEMDDEDEDNVYETLSELYLAVKDLSENQWVGSEISEKLNSTSALKDFVKDSIGCDIGIDWDGMKSSINKQTKLFHSLPPVVYSRIPLSDGMLMKSLLFLIINLITNCNIPFSTEKLTQTKPLKSFTHL